MELLSGFFIIFKNYFNISISTLLRAGSSSIGIVDCFVLSKKTIDLNFVILCDGLTLANCQLPTKLLYHPHSPSTEQGEKIHKSVLVEERTGRSLINYQHMQNRLSLRK